jgi:hypothetical protein
MTHDTALLVWPAVAIAVVALGVGTATLRGGPVGGPAPAGGAGRADRADERPANPPSFAVTLFTIQRDERRPHELREPAHRAVLVEQQLGHRAGTASARPAAGVSISDQVRI